MYLNIKGYEYMYLHKIKYVKQIINYEDREFFKKSQIIEENNLLIVKIDVEDFLFELCDALGIKRL